MEPPPKNGQHLSHWGINASYWYQINSIKYEHSCKIPYVQYINKRGYVVPVIVKACEVEFEVKTPVSYECYYTKLDF